MAAKTPVSHNFYWTLLLLVSFCCPANLLAKSHPANILILGDSLSAGYGISQGKSWVDLLSSRLTERQYPHSLINSSISGDTTANGLHRLPQELERHRPDLVLIELGANDGLRGMPLPYIKNNLDQLIQLCLEAEARVLLVGMRIPPNYGKKYTQQFAALYTDLAEQRQIDLLPFLLQDIAGQPEMMQTDGLHPNQAAQTQIMETVWKYLAPMLSASQPD